MTEPTMKERLQQALSVFEGKTVDEVADIVRRELDGEKAVCRNAQSCAVAVYLGRVMDLRPPWTVSVTPMDATVFDATEEDGGGYYHWVEMIQPVAAFIADFDKGEYPDLSTPDSLAEAAAAVERLDRIRAGADY